MAQLVLFDTIRSARSLPGAPTIHCRSFRMLHPATAHRSSIVPTSKALDPNVRRDELLAGLALKDVAPDKLTEHSLVADIAGDFHTLDEVAADSVSFDAAETSVQLALTKVETAEVEPAPLDVFLIIELSPEILRSARLRLSFVVQNRSQAGNVIIVANAIPDCVVDLIRS